MGKSAQTIGYWYRLAYHHGLCKGPIDAFLAYRGGDKTAWSGTLAASAAIAINQPQLWGGEKDQGGIVGNLRVMFGEAGQMPNSYLVSVFGDQTAAWRGMTTVAFEGGKYGAMNPYPQKPSYKVRSITAMWDDGVCWYPTKANVRMSELLILPNSTWSFLNVPVGNTADYSRADASSWLQAQAPFGNGDYSTQTKHPADYGFSNVPNTTVSVEGAIWYRKDFYFDGRSDVSFECFIDDTFVLYVNGVLIHTQGNPSNWGYSIVTIPRANIVSGVNQLAIKQTDTNTALADSYFDCRFGRAISESFGMNPAHMLVYAHTQRDTGREPLETINSASATGAADWFYAQGFGLCTVRRPEAESPAEFRRRIEKVAACSFSRSLADGLYYIDIANGEYDFASLPILTDDDVLDFKEIPTVLDGAINSVSIKYFDPARKESIITPPIRALGLISDFGVIHQTYDYPEIPTGDLATRVAHRELLSSCTPTRAFDLATTRKPYSWRLNTYFRLQLPKRGIADMVCMVGDLQHGQLKSGAIKLKAVQDIYSLPTTVYSEVEHGVDTQPSQTPVPIVEQRAFEAPYVNVVASLSRADLGVLPQETGFLIGAAADPAESVGFTMQAAPSGGSYTDVATGDFCPTALVVAAADKVTEGFTLSAGVRLAEVAVGAPALWDAEICVVKAIDVAAGTISLGRGCADTVWMEHAAGSRLFFYGDDAAADRTEYTDGETVDVKLLTNTGSQRLDPSLATAMAITFGGRQFRPYPPAAMTINSLVFPTLAFGVLSITAAHRDRLLQADQLVDQSIATIGPEPGTTYTIRYYADGVLEHTEAGITAFPSTYSPIADCALRVELESVRDGVVSWQAQTHEFAYYLSDPDPITDEAGSNLLDQSADAIY